MAFLRRLGFVGLGWITLVPAVLAAEEGGGGGDVAFRPIGWAFRFINFVILILLGYWMLRKAPQWFRGRAARIVAAIEDSRLVKQEADRLLSDSERRLAGLDQEVAQLRTAAQQDAAVETARIRATAQEEEAKVQRAADAEIVAAERAARMELKALVAQLAVQRAAVLLKEQVTPEKQSLLMRGFVQNLGSVN
jgi:F-type H+-transporting ATPase subunit b